ncbi:hypothetical protein TERTU_1769 [Teredinibacter turnerae T7901]|uniref:Uncharacterized protein n=1 Tax=Teredinibacter turnerae (strain ATCC 39867 / T7901) TaxID=377629 RepID=C5BUA1_TERTT|nr:hypothetical protein TERTU_1769 [Teredinibacter turnerae T7901]
MLESGFLLHSVVLLLPKSEQGNVTLGKKHNKKLHAETFYYARFYAFRCASFFHKNALRKMFR